MLFIEITPKLNIFVSGIIKKFLNLLIMLLMSYVNTIIHLMNHLSKKERNFSIRGNCNGSALKLDMHVSKLLVLTSSSPYPESGCHIHRFTANDVHVFVWHWMRNSYMGLIPLILNAWFTRVVETLTNVTTFSIRNTLYLLLLVIVSIITHPCISMVWPQQTTTSPTFQSKSSKQSRLRSSTT